jgi:CDP-glucose 4,6-dehydratase
MDSRFWNGKRVLITGHTGFKGGWLSLWLQRLGAKLVGYALPPPTSPSLFELAQAARGMISVTGDVRDLDHLLAVVAKHRPELVIHMAAQPLVRYSYVNPVDTYATNVMGTVHVLEAVRRVGGVRVVVNVTSDKCYENQEWVWGYREDEPLGGHDPYSNSKGCAELVTAAFRRSFFESSNGCDERVALASVRAGNVIGGGDWASDRLVPDIVRAILAGQPVVIRNPEAIRPWQHVLEPLRGYLLLAERMWHDPTGYAEAWNFGPHEADVRPVGWVVGRLVGIWGAGTSWGQDRARHPHEAQSLKLDCTKARTRLAWQPVWDLEACLQAVVAWYKAYQAHADMCGLTIEQIERYQQAVHRTQVQPIG